MSFQQTAISYMFSYILVCAACVIASLSILKQTVADVGRGVERGPFIRFTLMFIVFAATNGVNIICNLYHYSAIGMIFSIANLASIMICAYEWFSYIEAKLELVDIGKQLPKKVARIPLLVGLALIVTTPLTRLVFYYNENKEYTRGPLYLLIMGLLMFYAVYATVHIFMCISKAGTLQRRKQYYVFMSFLIFPVIGGVIDFMVPHIPVMELMCLLGLVTVYTSLQQSQIYMDSLTGLNNRRMASEYLTEKIASASESDPVYFFMCDVDSFKRINDLLGHNVGDRALNVVAEVLRSYGEDHDCQVARWGGDEFTIISSARAIDDPEKVGYEINKGLADEVERDRAAYNLRMSVGYGVCTSPYREPGDIIKEADRMMYERKPSRR